MGNGASLSQNAVARACPDLENTTVYKHSSLDTVALKAEIKFTEKLLLKC